MRLILSPLHEEYTTIPIRPSLMNLFNECPKHYNNNVFIDAVEKSFLVGKKIHEAVLTYLTNKDPDGIDDLCKKYWDGMYLYMYESRNFPDLSAIEKEIGMEFECGDILFEMKGSIDWVTIDMWLFDLKTASAKRKKWRSDKDWQFKFYSYMFGKQHNLENIQRDTWILVKWEKPKSQRQTVFWNIDELEKEISDFIEDLAHHYRLDMRPPVRGNHCFTCWLKYVCPLYTKHFNLWSIA